MPTKKSTAMKQLDRLVGEPMTFGNLLKTMRETDEVSQVELAETVGTSAAYISQIEHGKKAVSIEQAAAFAKALGYSETQFVRLAIQDKIRAAGLKLSVSLTQYDYDKAV